MEVDRLGVAGSEGIALSSLLEGRFDPPGVD